MWYGKRWGFMREPCVSKATGERTGIRVSAVQKRKVVKAIQQQTNNRIDKVTNDAPQVPIKS